MKELLTWNIGSEHRGKHFAAASRFRPKKKKTPKKIERVSLIQERLSGSHGAGFIKDPFYSHINRTKDPRNQPGGGRFNLGTLLILMGL